MIQTPLLDSVNIQTKTLDLSSIHSLLRTKHLTESFQALKRYLPSPENKIQFNPPWLGIALALHLNDEEALKQQLEIMGMKGSLDSLCRPFSSFQSEPNWYTHLWHHVAWSGNYSLLKKAIDQKTLNPDTLKTAAGVTVWHHLALSGNYKALKEAIDDKQFDPLTLKDNDGRTVWHHLALSGNYKALKEAIDDKQFDPLTLTADYGKTIWHYLAWSGNYEALKEAIADKQFDPLTLKNTYGATVWHYLAGGGNYKTLAEAIVDKQFDPLTLKNDCGSTVWDYLGEVKIGRLAWLELIQSGVLNFFLLENKGKTFLDLCTSKNLPFQLPQDIPLLLQAFIEAGQFLGSSVDEIKQVKERLLSYYQVENAAPLQSHPDIEKLFQEQKMFEGLSEKVGFSLGTQTPRMLESKSQEPRVPASLFAFAAQILNRNKMPIAPFTIPIEAKENVDTCGKLMEKLERNVQNNPKLVRLV